MTFESVPGEEEYERHVRVSQHVCVVCHNTCFFDTTKPTKPGQVYSIAGVRELSISGLCEDCFDRITMPPDEPDFDELIEPGMDEDERREDALNQELDDEQRSRERHDGR